MPWVDCLISVLQVLSKRIHYGKFVAEAKFRASPDHFRAAIRAQVLKFFLIISIFLLLLVAFKANDNMHERGTLFDDDLVIPIMISSGP